jgi:DNA-binding NarL/FixJ family response regulator
MNDGNNKTHNRIRRDPTGVVTVFPGPKTAAAKTSVLVVDDDPQVLRVLVRILDPALYCVRTAMTQAEALFMAELAMPSFILLDLHLSSPPAADGLECLKALRRAGYSQPIFILSADSSIDQAHEAARVGANGYLIKCDPNRFLEHLNRLLRRSMESPYTQSLPPSAAAYFETRGLSRKDIALLAELGRSFGPESEIARSLNRADIEIEMQFQSIRERLGAKNQVDLGRILGVLSCFAPIGESIC